MDPRQFGPQQRKARLSKLAASQKRARAYNQIVNVCPFGCADNNVDENGYCYHLVGTSDDKKTYEPMVLDPVRNIRVTDRRRKKLKDGDKLIRCSNNFRVYRDVEPTEADKRYMELHGLASNDDGEVVVDELTFRSDKKKRQDDEEEEVEITVEETEEVESGEGKAEPLRYKGQEVT